MFTFTFQFAFSKVIKFYMRRGKIIVSLISFPVECSEIFYNNELNYIEKQKTVNMSMITISNKCITKHVSIIIIIKQLIKQMLIQNTVGRHLGLQYTQLKIPSVTADVM